MTAQGVSLPGRTATLEQVRARGLKVLATLPYHYPRALVRAHGFHPMEVWTPASSRPDSGSRHFQPYACPLVVRGAAFLLDGGFGLVDAALVPHGCDALQGLGSVLRDFVEDRPPVLTLYAPRTRRAVDLDYLVAEYRRLGDGLVAAGGRAPTPEDWQAALAVEDAADSAMRRLYADRWGLALSDREFYTVVRAREYLLPEEYVELVAALPVGPAPRSGTPLVLSGIAADPLALLDVINDARGYVAADDLSTGTRRLLPADDDPDPWHQLARRYLNGPADATRADPVPARIERLRSIVATAEAQGVLVIAPTFCEPEQFYLPALRSALAETGTPLLFLEHEGSSGVDGQLVGRIEAFVETLEGAR